MEDVFHRQHLQFQTYWQSQVPIIIRQNIMWVHKDVESCRDARIVCIPSSNDKSWLCSPPPMPYVKITSASLCMGFFLFSSLSADAPPGPVVPTGLSCILSLFFWTWLTYTLMMAGVCSPIRLHGAVSQKTTVLIFTAMMTSNHMYMYVELFVLTQTLFTVDRVLNYPH